MASAHPYEPPALTFQVAAALYGDPNVAEWLLNIGAQLPALALEIVAAAGNIPVLERMLTLRSSSLPRLERAAVAAGKAMRTATLGLLTSAGAKTWQLIRNGGTGRCLFPGPIIPPAADVDVGAAPLSAVADAERRVLFIPARHVFGEVVPMLGYAVTGHSIVLSANANLTVLQRVTMPETLMESSSVVGNPTGVTFLTLPILSFEGPARAIIIDFPAGGDLYNILSSTGTTDGTSTAGTSSVILGALIPRLQQQLSQLPAAVLNTSTDGILYEMPPGPWRGRLRHDRVTDCSACSSGSDGVAVAQCAPTAADGSGGDDWYATVCGPNGYESVMVTYAKAVFPAQVRIGSYMPSTTQLRVLARRPEWSWTESTTVTSSTDILQDWSGASGGTGEQDSAAFGTPGLAVSGTSVASRACGTTAPWRVLWKGSAGDASDIEGRLAPAFLPADFPTQTLLVESCGLRIRGFANTDGGNVS